MIVVAVRWYMRFALSYRHVEELPAERGTEVDHVTVHRGVQRLTPLLSDTARLARHSPGDRCFVDETYAKVNRVWRSVHRTIDQHGQVIDVLLATRRDTVAARRSFTRTLRVLKVIPGEVVTDAAPVYPGVLQELVPAAWHHVEQYANNSIEADRSAQAPAATDARTSDGSDSASADRRPRLRAEPTPRPLRTRSRRAPPPCGSLRRSPNSRRRSDHLPGRAQTARRSRNATKPPRLHPPPAA
jgi:transposase-like protein